MPAIILGVLKANKVSLGVHVAFRRSRRSTYSYTPHAARIDESTVVSLTLSQTVDFVYSLSTASGQCSFI